MRPSTFASEAPGPSPRPEAGALVRHRGPAPAVGALLVLVALVSVAVGAPAQQPEGPTTGTDPSTAVASPNEPPAGPTTPMPPVDTDTDPATLGDERVAPRLWSVEVRSPAYDAAIAEFADIAYRLDQTRASYEAALTALVELEAQEAGLERLVAAADRRAVAAEARIVEVQESLETLAVGVYVSGDPSGDVTDDYDWENSTQRGSRRTFTESVLARQVAELAEQAVVRDRARREQAAAELLAVSVADRVGELSFVRDTSQASGFLLAVQLGEQARAVVDARLTAPVVGTDFQYVALDAYVKAADALASEAPACALRWQILAGVSRTEGRHGTYGNSTLGPDGTTDPPIVGIPLDGNNNTALIRDTDGGALDGDPVYDRAVGPMQFIPTTWRAYASDGTGNGVADPHNLYDATLAAGRLLCSRSSALDTEAGLRQALLSYNLSDEYVRAVSSHIDAYERLDLF
jgi:membrane-bound lytic murein transglycosylase B